MSLLLLSKLRTVLKTNIAKLTYTARFYDNHHQAHTHSRNIRKPNKSRYNCASLTFNNFTVIFIRKGKYYGDIIQ